MKTSPLCRNLPSNRRLNKFVVDIRFLIICILDRNPKSCWANLVSWALGRQNLHETFGVEGNWKTQLCDEYCYCGKCYATGRLRIEHSPFMPAKKRPVNTQLLRYDKKMDGY